MGLRAVVFDYGMVLTGPPEPNAYSELLRITGLTRDRLEHFYWADRHAFDEGKLSGLEFWRKVTGDAGLALDEKAIEELSLWDARMWTTQDTVMVAWQTKLKQHGIRTAILSNMGDTVLENIKREFRWIDNFDVLVWSYQLHMAKPDPAIYRHTLKELGTQPEETLFLDDKLVNVEAARALGMKALEFTNVQRLREDLVANGFDSHFPLPDQA